MQKSNNFRAHALLSYGLDVIFPPKTHYDYEDIDNRFIGNFQKFVNYEIKSNKSSSQDILKHFISYYNIVYPNISEIAAWFAQNDDILEKIVVDEIKKSNYLPKYCTFQAFQYIKNEDYKIELINWLFDVVKPDDHIEYQLCLSLKFIKDDKIQEKIVNEIISRKYLFQIPGFIDEIKSESLRNKLYNYVDFQYSKGHESIEDIALCAITYFNLLEKQNIISDVAVDNVLNFVDLSFWVKYYKLMKTDKFKPKIISAIDKQGKQDLWNDETMIAAKLFEYTDSLFLQNSLVDIIRKRRDLKEYNINKAIDVAVGYAKSNIIINKLDKLYIYD